MLRGEPHPVEIAASLTSTNTVMKERAATLPHGYTLAARSQTAGRGQRGNSWESLPGRNLTFSILLRPEHIAPARQFVISEAVALGIAGVIDRYLPQGMTTAIKWPNDIYAGDRKICGILIEHTLGTCSGITYTVAGAGVNINQERFCSDAPNPVSLRQITGVEYELDMLLSEFADNIIGEFEGVDTTDAAAAEALHRRFMARMWRNDGAMHPFRLPSGEVFMASVASVAPDGRLTLVDRDGVARHFYFKEVAFVL